ncbi:MAG: hypothetical protein AAFO82_03250 [Bacteroidota bacterium]
MKFLILNFLLVLTFGNTNAYADLLSSNSKDFITAEEELLGRVIIMVDEVLMRVDTDNPSLIVDEIDVFDQSGSSVLHVSGCSAQECIVNVGSLAAGTYDVTVTTDSGYTFSGQVTLN